MKKTRDPRANNARTHGAFSGMPADRQDFDEILADCLEEYRPSGRSETELVTQIAECFCRKRLADEFFAQQDLAFMEGPTPQPDEFEGVFVKSPESLKREKVYGFDVEEFRRYAEKYSELKVKHALDPQFLADQARNRSELLMKQMDVNDRLDRRLERLVKSLALVKTFKQVAGLQQVGPQHKDVNQKNTINGRVSAKRISSGKQSST